MLDSPSASESDDEDFETLPTPSQIENVKLAHSFIELIKNATPENGEMDNAATYHLRNPNTDPIYLSDPDLSFSPDLYLSCINASEATYNEVRLSILRHFPSMMNILSYHLAKKEVTEISGVVSVLDYMCIDSCHASTRPFADLDSCTICSEPRYTYVSSGRSQKKGELSTVVEQSSRRPGYEFAVAQGSDDQEAEFGRKNAILTCLAAHLG